VAKQVLGPNTSITVNGTTLSNYCSNISIEASKDEVEVTGFGEQYREFTEGLRDASINATFLQDYTTVDPCLAAMDASTTAGTVKVNPDTSSTVVYTLISKLYNYSPVSGGVGDANSIDVVFRASGTTGLTRSTV
jgi:hypothetical protein